MNRANSGHTEQMNGDDGVETVNIATQTDRVSISKWIDEFLPSEAITRHLLHHGIATNIDKQWPYIKWINAFFLLHLQIRPLSMNFDAPTR